MLDMDKIVERVLSDFVVDGKINVPERFTRVKIDVGTSINAPNSEYWLEDETNLCVFGFEPDPFNVEHVKTCPEKIWPVHLNTDRINNTFFLVETALTDKEPQMMKFYCTAEDSGCSSLYKPTRFALRDEVEVPAIQLKHFFELFPWDRIPYIEHLKIDAQNSDFDIIKGAGDYLKNVMFISVECTTDTQYENPLVSSDMKKYIEDQGFSCFNWKSNGNFYNKKFEDLLNEVPFVFLETD
jgi:hypothetical protein